MHRYPNSDDGDVAEGYSDFVVHTLATKWSTLGQLQTLVRADASFRRFVLRHIDMTADVGELRAIMRLARRPGLRGTQRLRRDIAAAARRALEYH